MPWTSKDAEKHTKAADSDKKRSAWADVANKALEDGASDASAIKQANAVVGRMGADPMNASYHVSWTEPNGNVESEDVATKEEADRLAETKRSEKHRDVKVVAMKASAEDDPDAAKSVWAVRWTQIDKRTGRGEKFRTGVMTLEKAMDKAAEIEMKDPRSNPEILKNGQPTQFRAAGGDWWEDDSIGWDSMSPADKEVALEEAGFARSLWPSMTKQKWESLNVSIRRKLREGMGFSAMSAAADEEEAGRGGASNDFWKRFPLRAAPKLSVETMHSMASMTAATPDPNGRLSAERRAELRAKAGGLKAASVRVGGRYEFYSRVNKSSSRNGAVCVVNQVRGGVAQVEFDDGTEMQVREDELRPVGMKAASNPHGTEDYKGFLIVQGPSGWTVFNSEHIRIGLFPSTEAAKAKVDEIVGAWGKVVGFEADDRKPIRPAPKLQGASDTWLGEYGGLEIRGNAQGVFLYDSDGIKQGGPFPSVPAAKKYADQTFGGL